MSCMVKSCLWATIYQYLYINSKCDTAMQALINPIENHTICQLPSSTKKDRYALIEQTNTLAEQSQYLQGSIKVYQS